MNVLSPRNSCLIPAHQLSILHHPLRPELIIPSRMQYLASYTPTRYILSAGCTRVQQHQPDSSARIENVRRCARVDNYSQQIPSLNSGQTTTQRPLSGTRIFTSFWIPPRPKNPHEVNRQFPGTSISASAGKALSLPRTRTARFPGLSPTPARLPPRHRVRHSLNTA